MNKTIFIIFTLWFFTAVAEGGRLELKRFEDGRLSSLTFPSGKAIRYKYLAEKLDSRRFIGFSSVPDSTREYHQEDANEFIGAAPYELYAIEVAKLPIPEQILSIAYQHKDDRTIEIARQTFQQTKASFINSQLESQSKKLNATKPIQSGSREYQSLMNVIQELKACNPALGNDLMSMLSGGRLRTILHPEAKENPFQEEWGAGQLFATFRVDPSLVGQKEEGLYNRFITVVHGLDRGIQYLSYADGRSRKDPKYLLRFFGDAQFDLRSIGTTNEAWLKFLIAHEFGHMAQFIFFEIDIAANNNYQIAQGLQKRMGNPSLTTLLQTQIIDPYLQIVESSASDFAFDNLANGCI